MLKGHLNIYEKISVNTVKRESLVAIIIGGFSNMTIWLIIKLEIYNSGISKDCYVFRSTGPIAVARRRSVGRSVGRSVRLSTSVTRQPIFGLFSKSVGIFLG